MGRPLVNRFKDAQQVANAVAEDLFTFVKTGLAENPQVHIALTGGTVGISSLAACKALPFAEVDLTRLHLWWGDERYVDGESADRNAVQARKAWLNSLDIPASNIHEFPSPTSEPSLESAASTFSREFDRFGIDFDLMLMGMGPDGHIASLFPGHDYNSKDSVIAESNSPKPPPQRLSFSYEVINRSSQIWFTVAGSDKADAVNVAFSERPEDLPVGRVHGKEKTVWYIDQTAGNLVWGC